MTGSQEPMNLVMGTQVSSLPDVFRGFSLGAPDCVTAAGAVTGGPLEDKTSGHWCHNYFLFPYRCGSETLLLDPHKCWGEHSYRAFPKMSE